MSRTLQVSKPIYPLIGIIASVIILVAGLITAKSRWCLVFLAAVWVLFLCLGYVRACLAVIPFALVCSVVLGGITWLISKDLDSALAAVCRITSLCVAVIPGLAMPPAYMVRCFAGLKMPRMITLAMMITFSFFPLLGQEVRQVREAMRTRGAGSIWNPHVFYRALLIPLMMRLINISDTLALSVETRGFSAGGEYTVYKIVSLKAKDIIFAAVAVLLCAAVISAGRLWQ